ncbi:hypothetical protein IGI04_023902 [Brassica rapa subsp. trilocularis]|uniref:Uncharacterized protein n=1 Tax=Brassica rapa subsp. trilocularis TaxID=1813537 RepID=A0ABQ7M578_BRACM|nr:hypothetical protein IGI04_023902 [Brassica rapa subsp. trilocularis]
MTRKKNPKPQASGRSPTGSANSSSSLRSSAKSSAPGSPESAAKQAHSTEAASPSGDSTTQVLQLDSKQQAPDFPRSELPFSCTGTEAVENQIKLPLLTEITEVEDQSKLQELSAATVETNNTATAQEHMLPLTQPVPDANPPQDAMKIQASFSCPRINTERTKEKRNNTEKTKEKRNRKALIQSQLPIISGTEIVPLTSGPGPKPDAARSRKPGPTPSKQKKVTTQWVRTENQASLPVAIHDTIGCSSSQTPSYVRPPATEHDKAMLCVDLRANLFDGVQKSRVQLSASSTSDSELERIATLQLSQTERISY